MGKIVIVGEGGSGKDYFSDKLVKNGMRKAVLTTTRPMREGEEEGVNYYYIDINQFNNDAYVDNKYLCVSEFNGWKYALSKEEWDNSDIVVLSPHALKQVRLSRDEDFLVLYITSSKKTRRKRLSKRNDSDSVERRLKGDKKDFKHFTDFDIKLYSDKK